PGPFLVLPNHPGYMDPPAVLRALWGRLRVRPVLRETNFRSPFLAPLGWVLGAIQVPETDTASAEAHRRAEAAGAAAPDAVRPGRAAGADPRGPQPVAGGVVRGRRRGAADVRPLPPVHRPADLPLPAPGPGRRDGARAGEAGDPGGGRPRPRRPPQAGTDPG